MSKLNLKKIKLSPEQIKALLGVAKGRGLDIKKPSAIFDISLLLSLERANPNLKPWGHDQKLSDIEKK